MRYFLLIGLLFSVPALASNHGSSTIPYTINTANNNIAIGPGSLSSVTTGIQNTAIGINAATGLTTGVQNILIVNNESLLTTGIRNVLIGITDVTTGGVNDAICIGTGGICGTDDIVIGYNAMSHTTSPSNNNVAIGSANMYLNAGGAYNTAIGSAAGNLYGATANGNKSVFIGENAGGAQTQGDNNVYIGPEVGDNLAGVWPTGANNIYVGVSSAIGASTTAQHDTINIGGSGGAWVAVTGTNVNSTEIATMNGDLNVTGALKQAGVAVSAAGSLAEQTISFQPGLITAVTNTKGVFGKFVKTSTVDNIVGSAVTFTCAGNPTITMYECGTTAACNSSPVTIGSVTVTASGTAVDGTINSATITAGDYVAWAISAGTCTALDIAATAQIHAN